MGLGLTMGLALASPVTAPPNFSFIICLRRLVSSRVGKVGARDFPDVPAMCQLLVRFEI